jgi:hypothetical protein
MEQGESYNDTYTSPTSANALLKISSKMSKIPVRDPEDVQEFNAFNTIPALFRVTC